MYLNINHDLMCIRQHRDRESKLSTKAQLSSLDADHCGLMAIQCSCGTFIFILLNKYSKKPRVSEDICSDFRYLTVAWLYMDNRADS